MFTCYKKFNFASKETHSDLNQYLKLVKGFIKPKDAFFFRAESFYNFATNVDELEVSASYGGRSLHSQSHGESFFSVFMNRLSGKSLYILDEPEAALSPARQMSIITRMHDLVQNDSQFIIATHSPIIMAYPDSIIYEIKDEFRIVKYEETENYNVMKSFVNNTERFLNILMG